MHKFAFLIGLDLEGPGLGFCFGLEGWGLGIGHGLKIMALIGLRFEFVIYLQASGESCTTSITEIIGQ